MSRGSQDGSVFFLDDVPIESETALLANFSTGFLKIRLVTGALGIVRMAEVNGEVDGLRDGVRGTGTDFELPDGGDERWDLACDFLDGQNAFGGSREGIATDFHGGGSA